MVENKTRQQRSALVTNIPLNSLQGTPYQTRKINFVGMQEQSIIAPKKKKKIKLFKKIENCSICDLILVNSENFSRSLKPNRLKDLPKHSVSAITLF